MKLLSWTCVVAVLTLWQTQTEGIRVLMLIPFGGKSQKNVFYGLGRGLVDRGHEVTFFNGYKPSSPVKGITEIVPKELADIFQEGHVIDVFKAREEGMMSIWDQAKKLFVDSHRAVLASKELDDIMKQQWDVVVLGCFTYSVYAVPYLKKIPFVFLTPIGYMPFLTSSLGNPTLPSLTPLPLLQNTDDDMSFFTRVQNVLLHTAMHLVIRHLMMPYCDGLVAEKFGVGAVPPANQLEKDASLVLLPTHPAMDYHQPLMPNTLRVGGLHCHAPTPLPKNIDQFIGTAQFVYFSLGSVVRPEDMSKQQRQELLAGLGALPYKVLLKWDTDSRVGLPKNVLPAKWFQQQDVLGDKRCRLFITHGGLASFQESVCHGVPMLALPLAGDHMYNSYRAVKLGVAVMLDWEQLTGPKLQQAVLNASRPELLQEVRARQKLIEIPLHPREVAAHWVEQVANGGVSHLRSRAVDMNIISYYSLDVVFFLVALLLFKLFCVFMMLRCCFRCCCRRKSSSSVPMNKRDKRD